MAKKQSFGDKILRQKAEARKMVKIIVATKKDNGHYCFTQKMVDQSEVQAELKAARA
jgi:hypothetical protein